MYYNTSKYMYYNTSQSNANIIEMCEEIKGAHIHNIYYYKKLICLPSLNLSMYHSFDIHVNLFHQTSQLSKKIFCHSFQIEMFHCNKYEILIILCLNNKYDICKCVCVQLMDSKFFKCVCIQNNNINKISTL